MTAPPARPHVGPRASNHPSLKSSADWGEGDVWDSGSDDESPTANLAASSFVSFKRLASTSSLEKSYITSPISRTRPSPIPVSRNLRQSSHSHRSGAGNNSQENSSASTNGNLSFSYTHLHAPSPSSYPPKQEASFLSSAKTSGKESLEDETTLNEEREKAGWTIVRNTDRIEDVEPDVYREGSADVDLDFPEGEMVVGEMDGDLFIEKEKIGKDAIKLDVDEIVKDPLYSIRRSRAGQSDSRTNSRVSSPSIKGNTLARGRSLKVNREREKLIDCLLAEDVNSAVLRAIAWSGVPSDLRPPTWAFLLAYLAVPTPARLQALSRKREEYASLVQLAWGKGKDGLDATVWHQIEIDVPRTRPGVRLWMEGATQRSLERILYVWAIRHPASGYVQGINDLVIPFYQTFLSAYIDTDPENFDPSHLPENVLNAIEADSFWCLSRLLDGIQDNYIFAQPGIHRSVGRMKELVERIDPTLTAHLDTEGVEFMQFAFRWMNCLLMREVSVRNIIRMWDTYLSEGTDAFSKFHLYVCCAFLLRWSEKLRSMDFQGIIMFLQSLPTQDWTEDDIKLLLSEAFLLSSTWENARSHLTKK